MRGSSSNQHNLQSNQANSTGRRLRRPLILGIVILSFLCLIGSGVGLFVYLHHRSNQQRAELLQLAEAAEAEQHWPEAEAHLRQYLELSANEASIHARIGTAIVKGSPNPEDRMRAEKFFARAMQLDPREASYRLAFAELQLTNLPHQALVEARTVLEQEPENLNAIRLLLLAQLRMEDAEELHDSQLEERYNQLCRLHQAGIADPLLVTSGGEFITQNRQRLIRALATTDSALTRQVLLALESMVESSESREQALLARVKFLFRSRMLDKARDVFESDLRELKQLCPKSDVVQQLSAAWTLAQQPESQTPAAIGTWKANEESLVAEKHLENAIALKPSASSNYWNLSLLQWWRGDYEGCLKTLAQGANLADEAAVVLRLRQCEVALGIRDYATAVNLLDQLEIEIAENPNTTLQTDLKLWADGLRIQMLLTPEYEGCNPQLALKFIQRQFEKSPPNAIAAFLHFLAGVGHGSSGDWDTALQQFKLSQRLSPRRQLPRLAVASCLARLGRYPEAVFHYSEARRRVKDEDPWNRGQLDVELVRCWLAMLEAEPNQKQLWQQVESLTNDLQRRFPSSPIPSILRFQADYIQDPGAADSIVEKLRSLEAEYRESAEFFGLSARLLAYMRRPQALEAAARHDQLRGRSTPLLHLDVHLALGNVEQAIEQLSTLSQDTNMAWSRLRNRQRIDLALGISRYEDAEKWLLAELDKYPLDLELGQRLAYLYWQLGRELELKRLTDRFGRKLKSHTWQLDLWAVQLQMLRYTQEASSRNRSGLETALETLRSSAPENATASVTVGLAAELAGNWDLASNSYQLAYDQGLSRPHLVLRIAHSYMEKGQTRSALGWCRKLNSPNHQVDQACLAAEIMLHGEVSLSDEQWAEDLFARLFDNGNGAADSVLFLNLGLFREYRGKTAEAIELTRQGLRQFPDDIGLRNNLAWYLACYSSEFDEAEQTARALIREIGEHPQLLDTLAVIYLQMQEPGEALAVLESIRNDQREFGHLLHLAECHRGLGNHDEAQRFLLVANNSIPESLSPRDQAAFEELRRAYPASDSIGATP